MKNPRRVIVLTLVLAGAFLVITGFRVFIHSAHSWHELPSQPLYSSTGAMTDQENNTYPTVTLGELEWMAGNLNVTTFRDGTPITQAKTYSDWAKLWAEKEPAWAWIDLDPEKGDRYGRLYNWAAVSDPRGLAPEGWEIPDSAAWMSLISAADVQSIICRRETARYQDTYLKGTYTAQVLQSPAEEWHNNDWLVPDISEKIGSNEAGFNAIPGGKIGYTGENKEKDFGLSSLEVGQWACWWGKDGLSLYIGDHSHNSVHRFSSLYQDKGRIYGMNVRCFRPKRIPNSN